MSFNLATGAEIVIKLWLALPLVVAVGDVGRRSFLGVVKVFFSREWIALCIVPAKDVDRDTRLSAWWFSLASRHYVFVV